ncbi:hypothetical protein ACFQ0B_18835 [Nonomuraea thailandensis]
MGGAVRRGGGVAAAATAVVVATGLVGGPAYAVTKGSDGKVNVEISTFTDPEGLEAALADAGVQAVVDYLPAGQTCRQPRGAHGEASGRFAARLGMGQGGRTVTFAIDEGEVPAGHTLVLVVSKSKDGDDKAPMAMDMSLVQGAVSECEPVAMPAPPADGTTEKKDVGPGFDTSTEDEGPSLTSKNG